MARLYAGSAVEGRTQAHDGRTLLDGHGVVLARAHRQTVELVPSPPSARRGSAASSRSAAKYGREASGSSASGGIVMRPCDADVGRASASASRKSSSSAGDDALLGFLAGDVDLDQAVDRLLAGASRRSAAESVESECTRRTRPARSRALRLCRWPMKSQVKSSRATSCLAISCSTRFSPTSCSAGRGEHGHVVGRDVLDRGQQLDVGRRATRARRGLGDRRARGGEVLAHDLELDAHGARSEVGDDGLPAAARAVAPVRVEALLVADRARRRRSRRPRRPRAPARGGAQREIGMAVHDDIVAETRAQRFRDVVADLVAADAGARPDGRGEARPDALGRGLEDAGDEPAPAGVHDRQPLAARRDERGREAVGAVGDERQPGLGGDQRVAVGPGGRAVQIGAGRRLRDLAHDGCRAAATGSRRGRDRRRRRPARAGGSRPRSRVVGRREAEVERRERSARDAALARP